ncbi:RloB domain-containing protein [Lactobacillus sp. PV037]|uniref:RloB family protein n=1 Tax=Lactobacillus sp. PV037 TaxID=2594496 RepID=UPI00223EC3EA|nr:RloB family protein [Lactobacillus sp. PV037]QNQ83770.1 RloB domain-containing protein [Lactobacillus sp. PV037]
MVRSRKGLKKQKESIEIFCEGESEKEYFNMLKRKYRGSNVKVKVIAADLSGKKLVEKAIKKMKHDKVQRGYIVFDRDEHSKQELQEVQSLASKNNIGVVFSSIDFEVWILLHFEFITRAYSRKELEDKLSGEKYFNTNYRQFKGDSYEDFLFDRIENAVKNAKLLYKTHNNWISDDPFTNIHLFIDEIFHPDNY